MFPESAVCRLGKSGPRFSVSPLENSFIHFRRESKNSDLAVSISRNSSKADPQDLIASDRVVPKAVNFYSDAGNLSCIEVSSIYEYQ